MEVIGLLGGMSWESTATYYTRINQQIRENCGGLASAKILLHSFNFDDVVALQKMGDWDGAAKLLINAARGLEWSGAGLILICTNTMHKVADQVARHITVPLLHIGDVTGAALATAGKKKPLLLATAYTMEQNFLKSRYAEKYGIEAIIPDKTGRQCVHDTIFGELCQGVVCDQSRTRFIDIAEKAKQQGADSIILGCTEIGLLVSEKDLPLPVFDTTMLHADAAVDWALGRKFVTCAA